VKKTFRLEAPPRHEQGLESGLDFLDEDGRVLQLRLMRDGIDGGIDEAADDASRSELIGPMHRQKQAAFRLILRHEGFCHRRAPAAFEPDEIAVGDRKLRGIGRRDLDAWFRPMQRQPRDKARARHRVPLVTQPAGVEDQRMRLIGGKARCCLADRNEMAAPVLGRPGAVIKQPWRPGCGVAAHGPLYGLKSIVSLIIEPCETAEIETALPIVLEGGKRCMLAKHIRLAAIGKIVGKAEPARDVGDDGPIAASFAGRCAKATLA